MQKIKSLIMMLAVGCLLAVSTVALPRTSYALFEDAKNQACDGAALQESGTGCATTGDEADSVNRILRLVLQILSLVIGVISVIMVIIGGIRFVTSQGDGNSAASARNTIIYALVGLVIAAIAQVLVQFVVARATTAPRTPDPTACVTVNPCRF